MRRRGALVALFCLLAGLAPQLAAAVNSTITVTVAYKHSPSNLTSAAVLRPRVVHFVWRLTNGANPPVLPLSQLEWVGAAAGNGVGCPTVALQVPWVASTVRITFQQATAAQSTWANINTGLANQIQTTQRWNLSMAGLAVWPCPSLTTINNTRQLAPPSPPPARPPPKKTAAPPPKKVTAPPPPKKVLSPPPRPPPPHPPPGPRQPPSPPSPPAKPPSPPGKVVFSPPPPPRPPPPSPSPPPDSPPPPPVDYSPPPAVVYSPPPPYTPPVALYSPPPPPYAVPIASPSPIFGPTPIPNPIPVPIPGLSPSPFIPSPSPGLILPPTAAPPPYAIGIPPTALPPEALALPPAAQPPLAPGPAPPEIPTCMAEPTCRVFVANSLCCLDYGIVQHASVRLWLVCNADVYLPEPKCLTVMDQRSGLPIPPINETSPDPYTSINTTVLATPNARSREMLVDLPLAYFLPPNATLPGQLPMDLGFEQTRAAEADGLCSLVLRTPCQWQGSLYNAVGPVLPVNLTSVLSANETLEAWEAVGAYFGWAPPPPPPSPPPAQPPPSPSPPSPTAKTPPVRVPAAKAPPPRGNSSTANVPAVGDGTYNDTTGSTVGAGPLPAGPAGAGASPPSPKPYTGEPVVTIGRRLQALAQRLGGLLGGSSSSSSSSSREGSSGGNAGSSGGSSSGSSGDFSGGSGRRLQQELLGGNPYTFDAMSDAWAGLDSLVDPSAVVDPVGLAAPSGLSTRMLIEVNLTQIGADLPVPQVNETDLPPLTDVTAPVQSLQADDVFISWRPVNTTSGLLCEMTNSADLPEAFLLGDFEELVGYEEDCTAASLPEVGGDLFDAQP